jgi:hypothetical protein
MLQPTAPDSLQGVSTLPGCWRTGRRFRSTACLAATDKLVVPRNGQPWRTGGKPLRKSPSAGRSFGASPSAPSFPPNRFAPCYRCGRCNLFIVTEAVISVKFFAGGRFGPLSASQIAAATTPDVLPAISRPRMARIFPSVSHPCSKGKPVRQLRPLPRPLSSKANNKRFCHWHCLRELRGLVFDTST